MNTNQVVTYSLLAHIRNTGSLVKGSIDIFTPLIKYVLHQMIINKDIHKGKNINEIKIFAQDIFGIDFPLPVLNNILKSIAREINTPNDKKIILNNDGSFWIQDYTFEEFNDYIESSKREIENLQKMFEEFCNINGVNRDSYTSIFDFIDKNQIEISKYLNKSSEIQISSNYTTEALFVDFFRKNGNSYNLIRKIYLGSIISCYLKYEIADKNTNVELIFDTNFIISLLDLNTPESTHTCSQLLDITKKIGYNLKILNDTIEETKNLLYKKAENFTKAFLPKLINPEDIYNACERRKLNKNDLERIADNLEDILLGLGITKIPSTLKFQNLAKTSQEYIALKKHRNTDFAALHDITAIYYIRERRGNKRVKKFEDVNCWFVNNSITHENNNSELNENTIFPYNGFQPETIKADELLNILWLSKPEIQKRITSNDLVDFGLNSLISCTLSESLPHASIIKELDDNIQKYKDEEITDKEIIRISTRIANRQLQDISEINKLAEEDSDLFVQRLKQEAKKQEDEDNRRYLKFEELFKKLETNVNELNEKNKNINEERKKHQEIEVLKNTKERELEEAEKKIIEEKKKRLNTENNHRKEKRESFIKKKILYWRLKSWGYLALCLLCILSGILFISFISEWNINNTCSLIKTLKSDIIFGGLFSLLWFIFSVVIIGTLNNKYNNESNIAAFINRIKIPDELNNINNIDDLK